jgi:hypothetical protein
MVNRGTRKRGEIALEANEKVNRLQHVNVARRRRGTLLPLT